MDPTDVPKTTEQALELLQGAVTALREGPDTDGFPREKVAKLVAQARARLVTTTAPGSQGFTGGVLACNELLDDALRLSATRTAPSAYQVQAISAIERSQALLYFVAFRSEPDAAMPKPLSLRPRSHRPAPSEDPDEPEMEVTSLEPEAIELELQPLGSPATQTAAHRAAPQLRLEAKVTFVSPTNFYLGFEDDISLGGLFVATYNRQVIGTQVNMTVTLPSGHVVHARGSVRWVRDVIDPDEDSEPGIGIGFETLSPEDRTAIDAFISIRAPMFHDIEG